MYKILQLCFVYTLCSYFISETGIMDTCTQYTVPSILYYSIVHIMQCLQWHSLHYNNVLLMYYLFDDEKLEVFMNCMFICRQSMRAQSEVPYGFNRARTPPFEPERDMLNVSAFGAYKVSHILIICQIWAQVWFDAWG